MKKEIEEIKEKLVSYLEEAGEYCEGSDIPQSAENCKEIFSLLVENGWLEKMPSDQEIRELYSFFLEDWIRFTGRKEDFPTKDEWEKGDEK